MKVPEFVFGPGLMMPRFPGTRHHRARPPCRTVFFQGSLKDTVPGFSLGLFFFLVVFLIRARLAVIVAKHNYRLQHESANVFASAKMQEYNIVPTAGWHRSLWSTLTTLNKRGVTDLNMQHVFCCVAD